MSSKESRMAFFQQWLKAAQFQELQEPHLKAKSKGVEKPRKKAFFFKSIGVWLVSFFFLSSV